MNKSNSLNNEILLLDVVKFLLSQWKKIFFVSFIFGLLGIFFYFIIPTIYEAKIYIQLPKIGNQALIDKNLLYEKRKIPFFFTPEVLQKCNSTSSPVLDSRVTLTPMTSIEGLQISFKANTPEGAKNCLEVLIEFFRTYQMDRFFILESEMKKDLAVIDKHLFSIMSKFEKESNIEKSSDFIVFEFYLDKLTSEKRRLSSSLKEPNLLFFKTFGNIEIIEHKPNLLNLILGSVFVGSFFYFLFLIIKKINITE
jgi:hypothetical protein